MIERPSFIWIQRYDIKRLQSYIQIVITTNNDNMVCCFSVIRKDTQSRELLKKNEI